MQQEVSLHSLQMNKDTTFAPVGGHRVLVDYAQAAVHFYKGEQEWGKLAATLPVEKWSGDWLIRTVGRFFRIAYQLSEDKAIASVQRNGYLTVQVLHRIGRAVLYRRILVDRTWDYCASFRNEVGFGNSPGQAVVSLKDKLQLRTTAEATEVKLIIENFGRFTEQEFIDFCRTNELTPGKHYTRQQLRQAILRQRKVNCERFRNQLEHFDIRINCK
jgi:hypothetical protein